ncbi:hypothetical protein ACZ90_10125 [Streptomyces albus subsp. albus]|nr:hypothetical protein ACZ90_10125 [Streptomyces albus subsp. albus]
MNRHSASYPPAYGLVLYARSRALPRAVAALCTAAALIVVCRQLPAYHLDPEVRVPAEAMAPVLAACAIGTSLDQHSPALDLTAVRPWRARRLGHLAGLTLIACLTLALVTPGGEQGFATVAVLRNLIGAVGVALAAATVIGARLSWAPTLVYFSMMYLMHGTPYGRAAALWGWAAQPGTQPLAWIPPLAAFAVGAALYVIRGARVDDRRS